MHETWSVVSQENHRNCCHEMSHFKAKMHQIRFRLAYFVPNLVAIATRVCLCKISLTSFDSLTLKTPVRRNDLRDIYYTSRDIVVFVSNLVVMATGVSRGRICVTSFNSPTPINPLLGTNISVIFPIQVKLRPILSQISLPWQPGSVFLKFLWRHSIAWPRQPPVRRKYLGDISYTSRVIDDFVSNFVAMATGVIRK